MALRTLTGDEKSHFPRFFSFCPTRIVERQTTCSSSPRQAKGTSSVHLARGLLQPSKWPIGGDGFVACSAATTTTLLPPPPTTAADMSTVTDIGHPPPTPPSRPPSSGSRLRSRCLALWRSRLCRHRPPRACSTEEDRLLLPPPPSPQPLTGRPSQASAIHLRRRLRCFLWLRRGVLPPVASVVRRAAARAEPEQKGGDHRLRIDPAEVIPNLCDPTSGGTR